MRYLLCDDDVHLRAVLTSLLESLGHEVVAEADTAVEGLDLLDRTEPDVLVVDLALRFGSGRDVVDEASAQGRHVIVFSAFTDGVSFAACPGTVVVAKPDFAALEAAIVAAAARTPAAAGAPAIDRRASGSTDRAVSPRPVDDPASFYEALADARADDVLLVIDVEAEADGDVGELGPVVRGVVRAQDRLMVRDRQLQLLLVSGGSAAAARVAARVERAGDSTRARLRAARFVVIVENEAPVDAFARLKIAPETFAIS